MKALTMAISKCTAWAGLGACLLIVTGCAPLTPMFQQLEAEKVTKITLVVEQAPFEYTAPVTPENPIAIGSTIPLGLIGQVIVQHKIGQIHPALNERARALGIANDHRQVFIAALVQQFSELGMTATVVPLPYERRMMNGDRLYFRPVPAEVIKLPKEPPVFVLNLDMGSCTVNRVTPCIRYFLSSAEVMTSPGVTPKYSGMWVVEPNLWAEATAKSALRFETTEDATARIGEFDSEIARLVPIAANRLAIEAKKRTPAK